jgi:outer membrane protein assembly factor BamD
MIKTNIRKTLVLCSVIILSACSSSDKDDIAKVPDSSPLAIYNTAKESLTNGNYSRAGELLATLDSRYPFGPLSHQVQLDLIYAYYKSGKEDQAVATIDRFVRLNPNHSDVDYALYMRGLVNQQLEDNTFQSMFGIERSDRDPTKTREAFADFKRLIEEYPESKYVSDARQRMVYLKNRLAKYELMIASYYLKRDAYIAAANRGKYVVEFYPDSSEVQNALELMVFCYEELGMQTLKDNTLKVLKQNFPSSDALN